MKDAFKAINHAVKGTPAMLVNAAERDENRFAYCARLIQELRDQKVRTVSKDGKEKVSSLLPAKQVLHVVKLAKKGVSAECILTNVPELPKRGEWKSVATHIFELARENKCESAELTVVGRAFGLINATDRVVRSEEQAA